VTSEVFSPEEVWALARAAASEQDSALDLTAPSTGLRRGELLALGWRDVDFAGSMIHVQAIYAEGHVTTPKSGKVRSDSRRSMTSCSPGPGPTTWIGRPFAAATAPA
jgi:integrase